jgi:hypothetical protein
LRTSIGRRLNPRANQLIVLGYAVKTLESKETRASKEMTVTHNSVFAAHRLQCRMTIHKVDIRHFVFQFCRFEPFDFARDRLYRGISYCSAPICRSLKLPLITRCPRRQTYARRPQSFGYKVYDTCPASTFATKRAAASPTSAGESSCRKCAPFTVTSC